MRGFCLSLLLVTVGCRGIAGVEEKSISHKGAGGNFTGGTGGSATGGSAGVSGGGAAGSDASSGGAAGADAGCDVKSVVCAPNTWDCNGDPCDGCEVTDLTGNKLNCGRCGRSCELQECHGGLCDPEDLGFAGLDVYSMTQQDGVLYWGRSLMYAEKIVAALLSMPVTGGTETALAAQITSAEAGLDGPTAVVTTQDYLYFSTQVGTIGRVPLIGGPREDFVKWEFPQTSYPDGIAVDDKQVFYTTVPGIRVVDTTTKVVTELTSGGVGRRYGMAMDAQRVYYTVDTNYSPTDNKNDYGVWSIARDGSDNKQLVNDATRHVVIDADNIYWIGKGATMLRRMPKSGGTITDMPMGTVDGLAQLRIEGSVLYWTARSQFTLVGVVGSCDLSGGNVVHYAEDPQFVGHDFDDDLNGLATDATHVYWTDHREIWRTPK